LARNRPRKEGFPAQRNQVPVIGGPIILVAQVNKHPFNPNKSAATKLAQAFLA